ncbi:MAG: hypothetical protein B1H13_10670 [Desulfobacteraceae bacterium 4484_190.3]|nr:MAG: hypothetical protein B1H13_10670 [Desulfobacteraceae bacterium 4484_190.3]
MDTLIQDLSKPEALPDETERVTVIQTHISIVFVADHFVYKVKKPVNFGFLDFSTLEKREYRGHIAEYAVKMKRIPEDRLMDQVFERGELDEQSLVDIAGVLARFHATAENSPEIAEYGRPDRFKVNTDENFEQVDKYQGITIQQEKFTALKKWTEAFYSRFHSLFDDRISRGRIRDCHGDLHMEHICLVLRTDMIRLEVLKHEDIFDEKVAANMNKRTLVYDEMFRLADELTAKGTGVILDATFVTQELRRRAAKVAADHNMTFVIQQTRCSKEVSLRRISKRTRENYESNALTEQAYMNNVKKFEPVDLIDLKTRYPALPVMHLVVDTSSDKEEEWFVVGQERRD